MTIDDGLQQALSTVVEARRPGTQEDLAALVRTPSITGREPDVLRAAAVQSADLLRAAGAPRVELLEAGEGPPAVWADVPGPSDAPTVLLYAHYDVQPPGDTDRWTSPPFAPEVRDGRMYGRGTADNKGAVVVHADVIAAWAAVNDGPPVTLRILVEGEEEAGSPNLDALLAAHADRLACDVAVVPDAANWGRGWPAITTSTRGLADIVMTVSVLDAPLHSGVWGGTIRDAAGTMATLVASLYDPSGRPVVQGFYDGAAQPTERERDAWSRLGVTDPALRTEAGVSKDLAWVDHPDLPAVARRWLGPAVNVVAIDAPAVADAANQLLDRVACKLSIRIAPGQDPDAVTASVEAHLRDRIPAGVDVDLVATVHCPAWRIDPVGPAVDAARAALEAGFRHDVALIGGGGSIALVPQLQSRLNAICLLPGLGDPDMKAHAENESMPLEDLTKAAVSESLLLAELATRLGGRSLA